jgi:hypothetical protein
MTAYRVYVLDPSGHVTAPPHIIMCDDDDQATHYARQYYLNGEPVEVWHEARCVVRLDPPRHL